MKYKINDKVFSPCYGYMIISEVTNHKIVAISEFDERKHTFKPDGSYYKSGREGFCMLFPLPKETRQTLNETTLSEILIDHIGDTFYSPILGECILDGLEGDKMILIDKRGNKISLNSDGKYSDLGDLMIFPDKNSKSWDEWIENNKITKYGLTVSIDDLSTSKSESGVCTFGYNSLSDALRSFEDVYNTLFNS